MSTGLFGALRDALNRQRSRARSAAEARRQSLRSPAPACRPPACVGTGPVHRAVRQAREPAPFPASSRTMAWAGVTRVTARHAPRSDYRDRGGAMSPTQVMVAILTFLVIVTTAITFS